MNKIRKGDTVIINTGKDKGKQGVVINLVNDNKVLVEGLNMAKKHTKPNPNKGEEGGLISKEMPIQISNIAIINNSSKKADKVTFKEIKDGKKIRIFKSNQEAVDV